LTNTSKENKEISPFLEGGKKRLSLDTKIFNTCGAFNLLTNTSNENKEISPFLEGGEKRLSLDTKIFNTCGTFHLTNTSKENKEISPFLERGWGKRLSLNNCNHASMHAVVICAVCGLCLSSLGSMHACCRTPEWALLDPFQFFNPPGMDCPTS